MSQRRTHPLVRALSQPIRATVHKQITLAETPISVEALAAAVGVDSGLVRYHVGVLVRCGLAEVATDGSVS